MSKQQFRERVDKQIPVEEKARWADIVINNNASLDDLKIKTRKIYNKLMNMQKQKERSLSGAKKKK
jgi:dephospho-CoA kinase